MVLCDIGMGLVAALRAERILLFGDTMVPNTTPIMENQMDKKMDDEMETGVT